MMFIVEIFIKERNRNREICNERFSSFSSDRLRTIIIPCDVETRVIAGRKDRIPYKGCGREETKETWNAKWREHRPYAERVRPRTTKIIFSLTQLRYEAENSSRRKEIARTQETHNIQYS